MFPATVLNFWRNQMNTIVLLAAIGAMLTGVSVGCVAAHLKNPADGKLFGKVPWWLIGVIGYILIAFSVLIPDATKILAIGIVPVTLWLIYKAIKIKLTCPFCPLIWLLNAAIAGLAFT